MKILGKTATLIMLILFFVSLCVLMYPSVSQYWNSHVQTKAVAEYNEMLAAMNKEDYTAYLTEQENITAGFLSWKSLFHSFG